MTCATGRPAELAGEEGDLDRHVPCPEHRPLCNGSSWKNAAVPLHLCVITCFEKILNDSVTRREAFSNAKHCRIKQKSAAVVFAEVESLFKEQWSENN